MFLLLKLRANHKWLFALINTTTCCACTMVVGSIIRACTLGKTCPQEKILLPCMSQNTLNIGDELPALKGFWDSFIVLPENKFQLEWTMRCHKATSKTHPELSNFPIPTGVTVFVKDVCRCVCLCACVVSAVDPVVMWLMDLHAPTSGLINSQNACTPKWHTPWFPQCPSVNNTLLDVQFESVWPGCFLLVFQGFELCLEF